MLSSRFVLRSRRTSDRFFNKYQFEADPKLLARVATALAELIPPGTEVLARPESGGTPIFTALSLETGLAAAFIRKEAETYGTRRSAEGAARSGKLFVLVEDVDSSGGAIVDALGKLQGNRLEPTAVLCVIDRETGGCKALKEAGLPLPSVFRISDLNLS